MITDDDMKIKFQFAPDIQEMATDIIKSLELRHIDSSRIVYMRSFGSKANAIARIWSLPKVWQQALDLEAHYVIEVLSEYFDGLSQKEKEKIMIHELLHIPKTFSGATVPHVCFGKEVVGKRAVEDLYKRYKKLKSDQNVYK